MWSQCKDQMVLREQMEMLAMMANPEVLETLVPLGKGETLAPKGLLAQLETLGLLPTYPLEATTRHPLSFQLSVIVAQLDHMALQVLMVHLAMLDIQGGRA